MTPLAGAIIAGAVSATVAFGLTRVLERAAGERAPAERDRRPHASGWGAFH